MIILALLYLLSSSTYIILLIWLPPTIYIKIFLSITIASFFSFWLAMAGAIIAPDK